MRENNVLSLCSLALSMICWVFVRVSFLWNTGKTGTLFSDCTLYVNMNEINGVENRDLISHHDLHISIFLVWINTTKYGENCTTPIVTISTRTPTKRQSSLVSTVSSIKIYSSFKRKSKRERRVWYRGLLPVSMLIIHLDSSYDHHTQTPTTYKPRCKLRWWSDVESWSSFCFSTCNVNFCLYCCRNFHQNVTIVQTKNTLHNQFSNPPPKKALLIYT